MEIEKTGQNNFTITARKLVHVLLLISAAVLLFCAFFMGTELIDDTRPQPLYIFTIRFLIYTALDIFDAAYGSATFILPAIVCGVCIVIHFAVVIATSALSVVRFVKKRYEAKLVLPVTVCYASHLVTACVIYGYTFARTTYGTINVHYAQFPPVALFGIIFAGFLILSAGILNRIEPNKKSLLRSLAPVVVIVVAVSALFCASGACFSHKTWLATARIRYSVLALPRCATYAHASTTVRGCAIGAVGLYVLEAVALGAFIFFTVRSLFYGGDIKKILVFAAIGTAAAIALYVNLRVCGARLDRADVLDVLIHNMILAAITLAYGINTVVKSREANDEENDKEA